MVVFTKRLSIDEKPNYLKKKNVIYLEKNAPDALAVNCYNIEVQQSRSD